MTWPTRNETCLCGSQKKVKNCCLELFEQIRPDSFVGKLIKTHSYIASIQKNEGFNHFNASCPDDCSASCCHTLFPISFIEDFYIRLEINMWPAEKVSNLLFKAKTIYQETLKKVPELYLFNNITRGSFSGSDFKKIKQYLADFTAAAEESVNIPCPFLEQNRCLIYRTRPLICRVFGSFREVHLCSKINQDLPSINLEKIEYGNIFGFQSIGKPIIVWLNNITASENIIEEEELKKLCKVPSSFVSF